MEAHAYAANEAGGGDSEPFGDMFFRSKSGFFRLSCHLLLQSLHVIDSSMDDPKNDCRDDSFRFELMKNDAQSWNGREYGSCG